jgi:hypothetical protein
VVPCLSEDEDLLEGEDGLNTPRDRDGVHALIALALCIVGAVASPDGWGVTVFIGLLLLTPNRRTRINTDADE